mgnify:CR=1 FL=1
MQKDGLWLRKCPFCGSDNVHIIRFRPNGTQPLWAVECCDCEAMLLHKTEEEAMVAWDSIYSETANDLPRLKDLYAALPTAAARTSYPPSKIRAVKSYARCSLSDGMRTQCA